MTILCGFTIVMLHTEVRVGLRPSTLPFEQSARDSFGIPSQIADDEDLDPQPALTQSEASALQLLRGEMPKSYALACILDMTLETLTVLIVLVLMNT